MNYETRTPFSGNTYMFFGKGVRVFPEGCSGFLAKMFKKGL